MFTEGGMMRRLPKSERRKVGKAFDRYLETIPEDKRIDRCPVLRGP